MNQQFDDHIKQQLNNYEPQVPEHLWQNIIKNRSAKKPSRFIVPFDNYINDHLKNYEPNVPPHVWTAVTEKRFDNFINDTISNYQPIVPAYIWDNIAKDRKEKKRPVFWFLFSRVASIVALLFLVFGGVWMLNDKSYNNPASNFDNTLKIATKPQTQNNKQQQTINNELPTTNQQPLTNNKITSNIYSPINRAVVNVNSNRIATAPIFSASSTNNPFEEVQTNENRNNNYVVENILATKAAALIISNNKLGKLLMPDCPISPDEQTGGKYIEVYAGPDYAFENITDINGASNYVQSRKNAAKFTSAYSAGIRLTKVFNNGTSIKAGVNYSRINETLKVYQGGLIQVVYTLNALGDTIGSYTINGTRYQKIHNHYSSIDIPIQMGYEINATEKIKFNISAGPVVNIRSWQKGATLDTAGNAVSITTGKAKPEYQYKTNTGVGFIGSAAVYYKLNNENTMLFAEPYFRYNISAVNNTEHTTIKQKNNTAGVRIGLRVKL